MRSKHTVLMLVLFCVLSLSSVARSQDLAALQKSFAAEIDALNSKNLSAALALTDAKVVLFGIFSPFPIEGKAGFQQVLQEYFGDYEHAVFTPILPEFRVIGATGVTWGNFRLATRQKNGPSQYSDGRYMFTYAQVEGKWVLISMHYSLLQPLLH